MISDRVMGGISQGTMRREAVDGRPALRIEGDVSLENNGGFLQIALDLARGGRTVDAGGWIWIETDALGNGKRVSLRRGPSFCAEGSGIGRDPCPTIDTDPK